MSTRFTVVIPTRERCDTLEWTLKTCVMQDYDNLEILVSDNNSADRTEEVARSFDDPRIRYINTGSSLSMTDNFEFALSHVTGGFVTCIGDDDGLLPNACVGLNEVITVHRCRALTWQKPDYFWSTLIDPNRANTLSIALPRHDAITVMDSSVMLRKVSEFKLLYPNLPTVYHGCIEYTIVQDIIRRSGRFFHSSIPDAYSAIAVTCTLNAYHHSTKPYSIMGLSGHSVGGGYLNLSKHSAEDTSNKSAQWLNDNSIPFHRELVMFPSLPIITAEAFFQVRDHLGCEDKPSINIKKLIRAAINEKSLLLDPEKYVNLTRTIEAIAAIHGVEDYARKLITKHRYRSVLTLIRTALGVIFENRVSLDAAGMGIDNIYDASLYCEHISKLYKPLYIKCAVYLGNYIKKGEMVWRSGARMVMSPEVCRKRRH